MKNDVLGIDNIANLLRDAFGVENAVYTPSILKNSETIPNIQGFELVADETADRLSMFGTPVIGSFITAGGKYLYYHPKTGILESRKYTDFEFPVSTIVDFRKAKLIDKMPLQGGGTVKEVFSTGDWELTIRGFCFNDPSRKGQKTAREQQQYLVALNEIAGAIEIKKGAIFLNKEITRLVIENLSFPAIQGKPNIIPFEITAVSDEDILLYDKNNLP